MSKYPPDRCQGCGAPLEKKIRVSGFGKPKFACNDCGAPWNDKAPTNGGGGK